MFFKFRQSLIKFFYFQSLLGFLEVRAIPSVELVTADEYQRTIRLNGEPSRITVSQMTDRPCLELRLETEGSSHLLNISNKVRRLFDLDADPYEVNRKEESSRNA